ncbi:MFS transporter [Galactobacter caseinivorans]|uniref:MFS transporter n=1 Tax=Galactobacter caseinivorans TaxID=2676123 RepID=A0A496PLR4_9MICC|nr:MFS transporter [Galactobacter caseinivorans]RKW71406.1 MFS transporter [Galactobacter caseinivorans]
MPRLLADITPLKVSPAYRRIFFGNALSIIGTAVTLMAVSLEVFELTQSSAAVGMIGLCALIPLIVAGLYGGAIADSFDRRKVALCSSLVLWFTTVLICAQAWAGLQQVWLLYLLTAIHSAAGGINAPTRGAIIPALVGDKLLPSANALNMILGSVGMMVAPVIGGFLVATVGFKWTYTLDVVTFLGSLYSVWRLPPMPPSEKRGVPGFKAVFDGFAFLATRPNVRMTFLIDLCAMILAASRALLPAIAAFSLGGGTATVGFLLGAGAAGSFLGAIFSGPLGGVVRQGRAVYWAVSAWGLTTLAVGAVVLMCRPGPDGAANVWGVILAVLFLLVGGLADTVSSVFRNTILQSATPDHLRGRLQGVFVVVVTGGPRLGDAIAGGLATAWAVALGSSSATNGAPGEGLTLLLGGLACVLGAALLMRWQPGFLQYDSRDPQP